MSHHLAAVSWLSLGIAFASALVIVADLVREGQTMWIMNVVWPVTGLWSGPVGLWAYFRYGKAGSRRAAKEARRAGTAPPNRTQPFPVLVAKGTTHCGSGCSLGDIAAEVLAAVIPLTIFGQRIFGAWVYDFVLAYLLGVAFQYFTIKPMRQLSRGAGLLAAIKADTLSLVAWQVGMYGWMAVVRFAIFDRDLQHASATFWFMMQIAMCAGFATSYPVNWWLLRSGIKEEM